jgi:hypothetical protein
VSVTSVRVSGRLPPVSANGLAIVPRETPDLDRHCSGSVVNGIVLSVEPRAGFLNARKRELLNEVAGTGPAAAPAVRRIATGPRSASGRLRRAYEAQR